MTTDYKYIGKPHRLYEGHEKVTGQAQFSADVKVPGAWHIRPIFSPYAHANILEIDKADAEALPGVVGVYTAADLPTYKRTIVSRNTSVLAKDRVLWVGQPVVAVVAETPEIAADAAELVFVDYEPLPAAIHLEDALKPETHTLWPNGLPKDEADLGSIHASTEAGEEAEAAKFNNVSSDNVFERGDIDAAFAAADVVVDKTYRTSWVHQAYMEPHAVTVAPAPRGGLTVYCSTQGKFNVRDEVARVLGLPRQKVDVQPMTIGGGFGAKYGIFAPLAAALACELNHPVSLVVSRSEDMMSTTPAPALLFKLKTAATADGTLTALHAQVFTDCGVFGFGHGGIAAMCMSFYKWPNLKFETFEVQTNKPPVGAYRAPASPQSAFALESNLDAIARQLEMDPIEFRLKNVVGTGDKTIMGNAWPNIGADKVLMALQESEAYKNRSDEPNTGYGVSLSGWGTFPEAAEAICRVDSDGTVTLTLGHVDVSGNNSTFILIAAETLGVKPEDVIIAQGGTTGSAFGPASGGSKVTYTVAGAVRDAAEVVKTRLVEMAADELEASAEDIELIDGTAQVRGVPDKAIPLSKLATKARSQRGGKGPIVGEATSAPEDNAPTTAAHLVKVRVDPSTGEITPLGYTLAQDVGFALNPLLVEGQMHGGMVQALGMALHERMVFDDDGQLLSGSFVDYDLPRIDNVPELETILVTNPSPYGPYGARGIGEPPITGAMAAVGNAIQDATGLRMTETPIRAETLWKAIKDSAE